MGDIVICRGVSDFGIKLAALLDCGDACCICFADAVSVRTRSSVGLFSEVTLDGRREVGPVLAGAPVPGRSIEQGLPVNLCFAEILD